MTTLSPSPSPPPPALSQPHLRFALLKTGAHVLRVSRQYSLSLWLVRMLGAGGQVNCENEKGVRGGGGQQEVRLSGGGLWSVWGGYSGK